MAGGCGGGGGRGRGLAGDPAGIKTAGRRRRGADPSWGFSCAASNLRTVYRGGSRKESEKAEEKGAARRDVGGEAGAQEVEAMVLGDLMRTAGGGGFPKQLAAISTDPIKINERAACESKPLRRPACSSSLFLSSPPAPACPRQPPPAPTRTPWDSLFHSNSFSRRRESAPSRGSD